MSAHVLPPERVHYKWNKDPPPALEIVPGDIVTCRTRDVTDGQVTPGCDASFLASIDFDRIYPLAGPISVRGAAQGDGEVCVTGIECPMEFTLRFGVRKGLTIPAPQFQTPGPLTPRHDALGYYATTGVGPDLMQCAKDPVQAMIVHLGRNYGLSPEDAYVLCSVVVDLKISEVVDAPNWIVSAYLPL